MPPAKGRPAKSKKKGARRSSTEAAFTARLTVKDSSQLCLTVTDKRPGEDNNRWNVDVKCLLCKTLIEKASDEIPEAPIEAPEDVAEAADGVAATSTVAVTSEATVTSEAEEEDSVVGKDDDTDMRSEPPTSDTAAPDPVPKAIPNGETTVEPSPA